MADFVYKPRVGKEHLVLSLFPFNNPDIIWEKKYPSFVESKYDGELIEDATLIEQGIMQDIYDVDGLKTHLVEQGVVNMDDIISLS